MCFRRRQGRFYLQIVERCCTGDHVGQQAIATLGWLDELGGRGQLDRLLRSGVRVVRQAMVWDAARNGEARAASARLCCSSAYGRIPAAER
jgi:hypothetical protein